MPAIRPDDLTPFGRAALKLDAEFAELARVAEALSAADVGTDGGLDEAVKLLDRAGASGRGMAEAMEAFAAALQEARDGAEAHTKAIVERAQLAQKRRQEQDSLQERLTSLKDEVKAAGATLTASSQPAAGGLSAEEKRRVAAELEAMLEPMGRFIEAAQTIKAEAAAGRFRRVERQADSVIDSLQASRRKITQVVAPKGP